MFGSNFVLGRIPPPRADVDPKDIPPPTPIALPRYQPFARDDGPANPADALPNLLKHSGRVNSSLLGSTGLSALGVDLSLDVTAHELIPEPSCVPDFHAWANLNTLEAEELNPSTKTPLRNGNLSPGVQVYLERNRELSNSNEDAFRTVRRIPPPKGKQHARLGNAYEFFRSLDEFTTFWDDPTQPPDLPPSPELSSSDVPADTSATELSDPAKQAVDESLKIRRTASGKIMPPEFRQNLLVAFIKLVAYDFGCGVAYARVEPRLQLTSPKGKGSPRKTYFASTCSFVWQSATTREAARAGLLTGPVAVVSARPTHDFTTPDMETAQSLDLAREVVAALIAAQHRTRQDKTEVRFGDGEWWTSKPRWGGGSGGPIGREVNRDGVPAEKEPKPMDAEGLPIPKKPRKNMSIYDSYRMIRPPASTWDKKTRYEAIGKLKGSDYDDIFVISSLFHHVSILRVRVPLRLLEVLDGSPEPDKLKRSWGKVKAWRSKWFDLFSIDQRIEAMEMFWGVTAYQMRKTPGDKDGDDVPMMNT